MECSNCGLIFANPMPGMDIVSKGNRALNILQKSRGTISQYRGGKEYAFILKRKARSGVLLDIGCAEGIFLKGIEENSDWKAEGLEIIKSAVDFANEVLNIKAHYGTLDSFENKVEYYNHIRMNNVIEHIQNPVLFLNKANEILKKGGTVYCSTPNGVQDGAILKVANKRGFEINLLENHFYYYPPKTLRNIFKHCGFKITHAYSEDISHSLKDFGVIPGIKKTITITLIALLFCTMVIPSAVVAEEDDDQISAFMKSYVEVNWNEPTEPIVPVTEIRTYDLNIFRPFSYHS